MTCPLCGGEQLMTVVETAEWKVRACAACTNAWTDPAPGAIDYAGADFHQQAAGTGGAKGGRKTLKDLPVQWRESVGMQAGLLERHLAKGARVLEIGCGEGILLEELKGRGFVCKGVEASEEASARARGAGLDVVTGYFPHAEAAGVFDCVVMSHVLEHLEKPGEVLRKVAGALAPGGRVLLVQTHWLGVMPQRYGAKWYAWVPEQHFWHFTPRGLEMVMKREVGAAWGVEVVEYSSLVHVRADGAINDFSKVALTVPGGGDQFHLLLHRG